MVSPVSDVRYSLSRMLRDSQTQVVLDLLHAYCLTVPDLINF